MTVLGFIGLGVMGNGMCRNVVTKHGAPVHAFDLNAEALAEMAGLGATAAQSIGTVAAAAEVIFLSLPGGKQVASVCEEIAAHAAHGTIVVDMSTTGVGEARAIAARMAEAGVVFVDAPCTGSGTWRRHPDTKWRLTPDQLERRTVEQDAVLDQAPHRG